MFFLLPKWLEYVVITLGMWHKIHGRKLYLLTHYVLIFPLYEVHNRKLAGKKGSIALFKNIYFFLDVNYFWKNVFLILGVWTFYSFCKRIHIDSHYHLCIYDCNSLTESIICLTLFFTIYFLLLKALVYSSCCRF